MSDEAIAPSPKSSRSSPPSETDYVAFRDAFMETARGRWFLNEFARRNRNADTRMVLDAVARIQDSIAVRTDGSGTDLADIIGRIKIAIGDARAEAATAMRAADDATISNAARKATRVIREIAWSLRECGNDPRICNILDAQLHLIDAAHPQPAKSDGADAVLAAFDRLLLPIDDLVAAEVTLAAEVVGAARPSAVPDDDGAAPTTVSQTTPTPPALSSPPETTNASPDATSDPAPTEDELARDEAVLALIATEMSVADAADDIDDFDLADAHAGKLQTGAADAPSALSETGPARSEDDVGGNPHVESLAPDRAHAPSLQPSLGEALLANGIVRAPASTPADPLAAIRRMSQAEKIALCS